jgi:chromatin assembly factor 1 subunit B
VDSRRRFFFFFFIFFFFFSTLNSSISALQTIAANPMPAAPSEDGNAKESWRVARMWRCPEDVVDLAWSPCGRYLASASTDNVVRVWDTVSQSVRVPVAELSDHGKLVQGVAWDPRGELLASQGSDRTVWVYRMDSFQSPSALMSVAATTVMGGSNVGADASVGADMADSGADSGADAGLPASPADAAFIAPVLPGSPGVSGGRRRAKKQVCLKMRNVDAAGSCRAPMFCDESAKTIFRRLAFSPEGEFLAAPTGVLGSSDDSTAEPGGGAPAAAHDCALVFARQALHCPRAALLTPDTATVVRWSPVRYALRTAGADGLPIDGNSLSAVAGLRYRRVVAVGTLDSVFFFDTEHAHPIAWARELHYSAVTDIVWTPDGETVIVASQDGFCSLIRTKSLLDA